MGEKIAMWWVITGIITTMIGTYRAHKRRPGVEPNELDAILWMLLPWFFLPIFIVRWIKYKIKGKTL